MILASRYHTQQQLQSSSEREMVVIACLDAIIQAPTLSKTDRWRAEEAKKGILRAQERSRLEETWRKADKVRLQRMRAEKEIRQEENVAVTARQRAAVERQAIRKAATDRREERAEEWERAVAAKREDERRKALLQARSHLERLQSEERQREEQAQTLAEVRKMTVINQEDEVVVLQARTLEERNALGFACAIDLEAEDFKDLQECTTIGGPRRSKNTEKLSMLRRRIVEARDSGDVSRLLKGLQDVAVEQPQSMSSKELASALELTELGKVMNKLRRHSSAEVADKASAIVAAWKQRLAGLVAYTRSPTKKGVVV